MRTRLPRRVAALITMMSVSLLVLGPLHLAGAVHGRNAAFQADGAGIAEVLIGVVLGVAALAAWRAPRRAAWPIARGAVIFAILGFAVGLNFTIRGGAAFDLTYHVVGLAVLISTLVLLLRGRRSGLGGGPRFRAGSGFGDRSGFRGAPGSDGYAPCSRG
ncbi:MAG TPA: hypothetical protein VH372_02735 [Actinospica sp.]|jgi:hypothetical protein|nr:hypothetical protein [Actinospica sp.]